MDIKSLLGRETKRTHLSIAYVVVTFLGHLTGTLLPPSFEIYGGGASAYNAPFLEVLGLFFVTPLGQVLSIFGFAFIDNDLGVYFSLAALVALMAGILFVSTRKLGFLILFSLCLFIISTRALYFASMGMGV